MGLDGRQRALVTGLGSIVSLSCGPLIPIDGVPGEAESGTPDEEVTAEADGAPEPRADLGAGADAVKPTAFCPASAATTVGRDARIRVSFEGDTSPTLQGDALQLSCNGVAIAGEVHAEIGAVVFEPSDPLPGDASCDASILDGMLRTADGPVSAVTWSFTTGATPGFDLALATPLTFDGLPPYAIGFEADADDVVLVAATFLGLDIARSQDRGEHFDSEELQMTTSVAGGVDIELASGVMHAAWVPDGQPWYLRSELARGASDEPQNLSAPVYPLHASHASVVTDGSDRVFVIWDEDCVDFSVCNIDDTGVFMRTSNDGGATFEARERVAGYGAVFPELGWVDGGLIASWATAPTGSLDGFELHDLASDGAPLLARVDGLSTLARLEATVPGEVAAYWTNSWAEAYSSEQVRAHGRSVDAIDARAVIAQATSRDIDTFAADADFYGDALVVVASEDGPTVVTRRISASWDGGATMSPAFSLDDLLDAEADEFGPPTPVVAMSDTQRIHLAWASSTMGGVRYVHGDRIAPCGE